MKEVAQLLEGMKASGVIRDYALFGAVAQMRYTEPMATLDADVLFLPAEDAGAGLDALSPIYSYCRERGHLPEGEAIRVGNWPVQFVPAFSPLTEEAVRTADTDTIETAPLRVVRAEHLAVNRPERRTCQGLCAYPGLAGSRGGKPGSDPELGPTSRALPTMAHLSAEVFG